MPGLFYSSFNTKLGKWVVHAWPRKRPNLSEKTKRQNETFRQAMALVKFSAGESRVAAGELAAGKPFLPQDFLMASAYGTMVRQWNIGGKVIRSYRIMNSEIQAMLDSISSIEGCMLVRGPDGWAALLPGDDRDVVTFNASTGLPEWQPAQGGGGGGGGIDLYDPPPASEFPTIINGRPGTHAPAVSDGAKAMLFSSGETASGDCVRAAMQPIPNASLFTVTVGMRITLSLANYRACGLYITDGTKFAAIQQQTDVLNVSSYTDDHTFNGVRVQVTGQVSPQWYFQMQGDGTNLNYRFSLDGVNFVTLYSEALGAWLGGITKIGVGADAIGASSPPAGGSDEIYASVFYWNASTP